MKCYTIPMTNKTYFKETLPDKHDLQEGDKYIAPNGISYLWINGMWRQVGR